MDCRIIVQVNSLVKKSVISRNDAWIFVTLLSLGPTSTTNLASEVGATERTIQRALQNLKAANLVAKDGNLWMAMDISSTTNLSASNSMSVLDKNYTDIQEKQTIPEPNHEEREISKKEGAASIPSADLVHAAKIFGQPWIAPHLEKIVVQVLAGRPYYPEPFFEAVTHTINEVRHPEYRRRRGLQPVRNPLKFFRGVFANMYENYCVNLQIAAIEEFAHYAEREVAATAEEVVWAETSVPPTVEEIPANPQAQTVWDAALEEIRAAHEGKLPTPILSSMVPVAFDGHTLILSSAFEFNIEWLRERHLDRLNALLHSLGYQWSLSVQPWREARKIAS